MQIAVRTSTLVAAGVLGCFVASFAQNPVGLIEGYYPTQLTPGQTTTLNIAIHVGRGGPSIPLRSLEIDPPDGVSVGVLRSEGPRGEGIIWWAAPITVAKNASPGPRSLVAVRENGRTQAVRLTVPDHVLTISKLEVTSAAAAGETIEVRFAAEKQGGGVLDAPMAWFTVMCGAGPQVGVVRARAAGGMVTAAIPSPKTLRGGAAPASGQRCSLELRATDQSNVESNTLETTFAFS